jgi:hypothetical protein
MCFQVSRLWIISFSSDGVPAYHAGGQERIIEKKGFAFYVAKLSVANSVSLVCGQ